MSYFLSPAEETDLNIALEPFHKALEKRWGEVNIEFINAPESNHDLEWSLQMDRGLLEGSIDKTHQVIHLDGDIYDCASFAVWARSQISSDYELLFYDEGFSSHVILTHDTTEEEIVEPFIA